MLDVISKVVEKLSAVIAAAGTVKNIVKESGILNDSLEKNINRLGDTLHKRADEITHALNKNGASTIESELEAKDPTVLKKVDLLAEDFNECLEAMSKLGINNASTWLLNRLRTKNA